MRRVLFVLLLAAAPPALAGSKPHAAPAPHDTGDYGGVVPGQPHNDEGKAKHRHHKPQKGELSWIGFQAKDGGTAEVFLQSVAPFDVTQHVEHGTLVVQLAGLDRLGQNTWRPINTRFFDTPLDSIVALHPGAHGKHARTGPVELRITFKNAKDAAQAQLRSATEADGYFYSYLTFAGGDR